MPLPPRRLRSRRQACPGDTLLHDDLGFTLIEVVVALSLLAVSMAALAGVFYSSIRTAGALGRRTDGSALASRDIEAMKAVPYTQVGFYGDQTGYAATFETLTTVSLGTTTSSVTTPQVQPVTPDTSAATTFAPDPDPTNAQPVVINNVSYSIHRYIVWVDAVSFTTSTTLYAKAYKRVTVIVTWTDQVGTHTVRDDSVVYPGGLGAYSGPMGGGTTTTSTTTAVCPPAAPVLAAPTVPAAPAGQTEADLSWIQPAGTTVSNYSIQYATNSAMTGATSINNINASSTTYQVAPLGAGTLYYFKVVASCTGGSGATSNLVSATTLAPSGACTLTGFTVTGATSSYTDRTYQNRIHITGPTYQNQMSENLSLALTTNGTCTHVYSVSAALHGAQTADGGSPYTLANGGSGHWTGTVISQNQPGWTVGAHDFIVLDNGTPAIPSTIKSFVVCAPNTQGTSSPC